MQRCGKAMRRGKGVELKVSLPTWRKRIGAKERCGGVQGIRRSTFSFPSNELILEDGRWVTDDEMRNESVKIR